MSDVVHAFVESPQFKRGALFIVYDEWGGFFDHVKPRFVPDDRQSKDLAENYGFSGFRIPAVVVSPYVKRGAVSHATCMFESILKLISYRFKLGHLNKRHRYAFNIGRTFNWEKPNFKDPSLPDPEAIAATPCSVQGRAAAAPARQAPRPGRARDQRPTSTGSATRSRTRPTAASSATRTASAGDAGEHDVRRVGGGRTTAAG